MNSVMMMMNKIKETKTTDKQNYKECWRKRWIAEKEINIKTH